MLQFDRASVIALLFAFAGFPTWAGSPTPIKVFARPGVPSSNMETELADCVARSADVNAVPGNVALAQTNGALLGALLFEDLAGNPTEHAAKRVFVSRCMRARGYFGITLTPSEAADLKAHRTSTDVVNWRADFYASPDFSKRLEAALHPIVPPLPDDPPEGPGYGALRLEPSRMVVASGVLGRGSVVLFGPAAYRATAQVRFPVAIHGGFGLNVPAGTQLHFLTAAALDGVEQGYWCGPMVTHSIWGLVTFGGCVTTDEFGYVVLTATGASWLATGTVPRLAVNHWTSASTDFSLVEPTSDVSPPLAFEMKLTSLDASGVTLAAIAKRDGKSVTFWSGSAPFDDRDTAVVPFWTHRLLLTRLGSGVRAALEETGDGAGWEMLTTQ